MLSPARPVLSYLPWLCLLFPGVLMAQEAAATQPPAATADAASHYWLYALVLLALFICMWLLARCLVIKSQAKTAGDLKAAEQRIRQLVEQEASVTRHSEQRWKLLFEQSPLSIQIFSPDGQTKRFNKAWSELFRMSDEMGYAFNVLKDPDLNASGAVNLIRQAFEGQAIKVPPVPFPVSTEPPDLRWIGGVLYPVKDDEGNVMEVVTIHHDITEMKRAEDAMLEINQTLEQKVKARTSELSEAHAELARALSQERELGELKSRFVSMVSHEFRTPLGVTMSAVELMRHYDEKLSPERRRELYNDIHSATNNMAGMMEQVLLLGRVEAGKLGFKAQGIDLDPFLRKTAEEAIMSMKDKCVVLCEFTGNLSDAHADGALLRHIFSNLVSNAVKYSPEGSEVVFRAHREGEELVCEVRDKGIGIPEKDRSHLYEAFHRCENVGDIQGTGLGLVIVKRCVDLHSGSLTFESETGQGTTFTVRLPVFNGADKAAVPALQAG